MEEERVMEPGQWLNDELRRNLQRIDAVQAIIEDFLDSEVIPADSDYKGYDTTGVAKRIIAALDGVPAGGSP